MADNAISIQTHPVKSKDRGDGVQIQQFADVPATAAAVLVASVTATGGVAFAADTSTRRQMIIENTGSVTVEISPTSGFAIGAGFKLAVGGHITTNYNGAIHARTASGTGELRAWSEN